MAKRRRNRGDPPATTTPRESAGLQKAFPWWRVAFGAVALVAGLRLLRAPEAPSVERLPSVADRAHDVGSAALDALGPADLVTEDRTLTPADTTLYRNGCEAAMQVRRWILSGASPDDARAFVTASIDDPALRQEALGTLQCGLDGCTVMPPVEALERLSTAARARVYQELLRHPENRQASGAFRRSLADGPFSHIDGMPAAARPWLDRAEFTVDGRRVLIDTSIPCAHVLSASDRTAMFSALQGVRTVAASLRVSVDPERVARGFRPSARDAVRARLTAARRDGESSVPLREFMPPAIRERLDRYPSDAERDYNCFWTALRFDLAQPVWPLNLRGAMRAALPRTHHQVRDGSLYFGDVILFADATGVAIHAVNYLVGGLVFTKNGPGHLQPWRVVRLDDISVTYPEIAEVTVWRPNASE